VARRLLNILTPQALFYVPVQTATFAVSSLEDIAAIPTYICSVPAGRVVDIVINSIAEGV